MVARLGLSYLDLAQKPPVPHATIDPLSPSLSPRRVKPRTLGTQTSSHSQLRSRALGGSSSNPFLPDDSFRPPPWLLEAHPAEKPQWMLGMEMDHTTKVNNTQSQSQRRRKTCKKKQRKEEYGEEESAVKKAFSSLVLMIRETQSYSLRLREILFYEDLKEVLFQVQREVHASFCWLFHRVFSCTPTLMLSLMLLLANFTVYSISNPAIASIPPQSITTSAHLLHHQRGQQVDRSMAISRTTHLDGGGGGGGKRTKPVAGARDDSGRWWSSRKGHHHHIHWRGSRTVVEEEEEERWKKFVEEAEMEKHVGGLVDRGVRSVMVAPVWVEVEPDNVYPEFFKTELVYRRAIEESPNDQMLLSNYAQFLFLVAHDHSRAEHYFKRAIKDLPADAETLGRYANFLWIAKKDLSAAEETFLEAIGADPCNTAHAANYAHFLWSTGSEDTCFPLDGTI